LNFLGQILILAWIFGGVIFNEITIKVILWHFKGPSPPLAHGYNLAGVLMIIFLIHILLMMLNLNINYSNNYPQ
jgi:hypothetical protein